MQRHAQFVPLHVHTEYSLLDGAIRIDELVKTAVEMRMPAVAVTDHGNLFGAVDFYRKASKAGVKPIIGCEVYVAPKSRLVKERAGPDDEVAFHLVLLVKDANGYRNLSTLVSKAYTEGFYYRPRIDLELLEQYSGGLVGLSACMKGQVPYHLLHGMKDRARELALRYKHILGPENFYIELQDNGLPEQERLNKMLLELAWELNIPPVATNDCHFLRQEDSRAHDILLCIQTGKEVNDPDRFRFDSDELYFKSPQEMQGAFSEVPEAVLNTVKVAEMCNFEFEMDKVLLPKYELPGDTTPGEELERLAKEGLMERFGTEEPPAEYTERLMRELSVMKKMGFESYFLIVRDFVHFAKERGIPVGPGRGSAAGSLVSYALGITELDPIKYNLLFERFLNPERISLPDIDIDFCKDGRAEVINYVTEKYGKDHVAQIITFGTMAAKAAIRDVGRALGLPYNEVDRIAKLVPNTLNITIDAALIDEPRLEELYKSEPKIRELIDIARRLEGLSRHASTHAAGIVISPEPLTDYAPLYRNTSDGSVTTQFDMGSIEKLGLIKFDLLGLKTLTVLEKAMDYISASGSELSLKDIPFDDEATYRLLSSGMTTGVFQLESRGMKEILLKMAPGRFEDLIALVALYRPGPIGSGMIDDFIKRKQGKGKARYELPVLREVLDETYGVILYQEQVMSIANKVAGFSMGQADVLRKAMGKKQPEEMERLKEAFIKGATERDVPERKAKKLFELMAKFAEYGFNKSHSAAYAYLAYQTAYLKAHYPVQFMAATLSTDIDNSDKIVKSINELRNMDIAVLPPDINLSGREFEIIDNSIRFGLVAVKGVGEAAIESVIEARDGGGAFESFEDFLERTDTRKVNKKVIEALVKSGAFDTFAGADEPPALSRARCIKTLSTFNGAAPTLDLFQDEPGAAPPMEQWDEGELLRNEKESLGFYISGNPLDRFRKAISEMNVLKAVELEEAQDRQDVEFAGVISGVKRMKTRQKGALMAYLNVEDDEGTVEVIVFPDLYRDNAALLEKDSTVLIKGTVDRTEKGVKLIAREFASLEEVVREKSRPRKVEIRLVFNGDSNGAELEKLRKIVEPFGAPGDEHAVPLYLKFLIKGTETVILTGLNVKPGPELTRGVESLLGKGALKVF